MKISRWFGAAAVAMALASLTDSSAFAKNAPSCTSVGIAPPSTSVVGQMPASVLGLVFEKTQITPGGDTVSENPTPSLLGPNGAAVTFDMVPAGRPGWMLLQPTGGLLEGKYTIQYKVSCEGNATDQSTVVTVAPALALPTEVGVVRIGESLVAASPSGKKSSDGTSVIITPSKELAPYLGVIAWRATVIAPDGVPQASQWSTYGNYSTRLDVPDVRLAASAFCPLKGPQRVEIEAEIPGRPVLKTSTTWDVGELTCDAAPASGNGPAAAAGGSAPAASGSGTPSSASADSGCSVASPRSGSTSIGLLLGAIAVALAVTRRRASKAHVRSEPAAR